MTVKDPRRPLPPVKQRLKSLIDQYKEAQREQVDAASRLDAANARLSEVKLQLAAHVQKHKIDSYRAIFAIEKDRNGKSTWRKVVGGKNLEIKGVIWPSEFGAEGRNPSTGHGGPQTPECEEFCDDQMNSISDDPNFTGGVWCICNCTLAAGGGAFPGALECFAEDEIPEAEMV
jgi:hypothetical protein